MIYSLFLEPEVHTVRQTLPGNIRQRIRRVIEEFKDTPRPAASKLLDTTNIDLPSGVEIWRVRIQQWRIVYAIHDAEKWVWVLGMYRRPPYDYDNISDFARKIRD